MFKLMRNLLIRHRRRKLRNVFQYFDGQRMRSVDPFAVYRALDSHPRFTWDHLNDADAGDGEALDIVVAAGREVFDIGPYDEHADSLTAAEVLEVLAQYGEWIDASKKKSDRGSTSLPPAAGTHSVTAADLKSTTSLSSASR